MLLCQYDFPQGFRWGTATSSYQVEGHSTNNDWWAAARAGGYIYRDQSAGQACDWWHRAEEDFDRMALLNQNAHRLSVEWSRIEPEPGVWDETALARYREMVQGLRDRGIEPMVTLHHFTNPLWLVEQGGWENENVVAWFEQYARRVVSALGDLVDLWCTINEPAVMIAHAYGLGRWPPGKRDLNAVLRVTVNVVRAHAAAYHAIHDLQPQARVGIAKHVIRWLPWRRWLPPDRAASFLLERLFNHMPLEIATRGVMRVPGRRPFHLPEAASTLDWLGINYYSRYRVQLSLLKLRRQFLRPRYKPGAQKGPGEWGEIDAGGIFFVLEQFWRTYRLPLLITENGLPDETDQHRPDFIISHLHQVWRALQQGIPVAGYYFWSLVDNFEWTEGYDPRFRFGLIEIDFATQARRIRRSGWLYGQIAQHNALTPALVEQFTPALFEPLFPG